MIPIKLKIRNFMCYRDNTPPLHFDGIHTACICGNNGNGKSALVDAMTWALWGKTRAKNDDDLIHQGQPEMEVEFDCAVSGQVYRIIRKHARPRGRKQSGQTILELQIASGDGFRSITEGSITQTRQKIIDILHMDYDTFINSAFLRQGHADEFTRQAPVKRKEVLANILGLSFYDELEEHAKDLAREQEAKRTLTENTIRDIVEELTFKPAYQAEFEEAQGELSRIELVITEYESRVSRLRQQKQLLQNKKLQLIQLDEYITTTGRELERRNEEIKQHHSHIREYEELIARRPGIEDGYARFSQAKKQCDELDQKLRQVAILKDSKHSLETAIGQAQQFMLTEHKLAQRRTEELKVRSQRLPQLKSELKQLKLQRHKVSEQEEGLRRKRAAGQELRDLLSRLESSRAQLEKAIGEVEEKLGLLSTQTEAKCPLCETELGTERIRLIETKYATEKDTNSKSLESKRAELAQRKLELESLEGELFRLEAELNQNKASVQSKASILSKELTEAEEATQQLNEEMKRLTEIELHLAKRDFAPVEQQALAELEDKLAGLDYNPEEHDELRHRLAELGQYEKPKRRLEEADRYISQEREAVSRAEEAGQELCHRLENDNQKRGELSQELDLLPGLVNDLTLAETEYQALAGQQKQAQETVGRVKAKLGRCAELEVKKKERERLLAEASKQEKIYKDLAQAFGKRGIQALLIETALPQIEVEANRLLARMTDNRLHIKFETQRETKLGNLVETLDINISDELGMRNYEMFSGGEAFRINFAIRIALSKLLARRAGAPLPTLIIDEGFGTQDNAGIEKLKEAINSIQGDFDKILVITHMEELKDVFPARINVIKTADGSTIEMN